MILLMSSEVNLHRGFFRSIEEIYAALNPFSYENPVLKYEDLVRNNREWFLSLVDNAHSTGHSLEKTITINARFQFYTDYPRLKNKTRADSIEYIACTMRLDPRQSEYIREKAKKNNIPYDRMIQLDAEYIYSHSKKNP